MDSLRNRQEGRGVSKDVRYADVPKAKPVSQVANELLQKLPGNVQVSVGSRGRANQDESVTERVRQSVNAQNVTFGIISLWVYLQVSPPLPCADKNGKLTSNFISNIKTNIPVSPFPPLFLRPRPPQ